MLERLRLLILQWLSVPPDPHSDALLGLSVSPHFQRRDLRRAQLTERYRNGKNKGVAGLAEYAVGLEYQLALLKEENAALRTTFNRTRKD